MTIWTDRSPICALFPGVLRGLLTDYQWEGVDPRHPNTSNNSSTTFTLSTSTPHFQIFLAFFVCGYIFDYFWANIDSKRHPNGFNNSSTAFPFYNCQHQHLIGVISQHHCEHIIPMQKGLRDNLINIIIKISTVTAIKKTKVGNVGKAGILTQIHFSRSCSSHQNQGEIL